MATEKLSLWSKLYYQVLLLLWKRHTEVNKNYWEYVRAIAPPVAFFILIVLAYETFGFFSEGAVEPFLVPIGFFVFTQRIVIQIMYEKSNRLQEAMKMMGMLEISYWLGYFITEAIITGFVVSFLCTIVSSGGLFNGANFGTILGILLVYCLSVVPFCFFITCFFDTPQTAGQATLGVLFGCYVVYVVVFLTNTYSIGYKDAQVICCLFPPIALQIASGSFLKSYDGIPVSSICGIMVADIFIYSVLTWYFSQVWPSKLGVKRPFYFPLLPSYWKQNVVNRKKIGDQVSSLAESDLINLEMGSERGENTEAANEQLLGRPVVIVKNLKKTFGNYTAVNNLSFKMYENQIFCLLGHNGAGKTTTISMLTGLISPDYVNDDGKTLNATIYGNSILTNLNDARLSMGVCPQHDVLFENLTVREHILFFARLKGATPEEAEAEAIELTKLFHLEQRLDNTGDELSGGQKRKLSVAIAVCGGSKFVVLDEPTAGMDPLARRELWDLLSRLRKGRTMLLTTHYMDEADVLGDRVGIMAAGKMVCLGSTQFLKIKFGPGYKLILDRTVSSEKVEDESVVELVKSLVPSAEVIPDECVENQIAMRLSYSDTKFFGKLFSNLDQQLSNYNVKNYGISGSSLEEVFVSLDGEGKNIQIRSDRLDIGSSTRFETFFLSQVIGIAQRKLAYAMNDFTTIPLLLLPIFGAIGAGIIYQQELISKFSVVNAVVANTIYTVGYLGIPGILAEFVVRERNDKLKNVLNVMGCDYRAYWIGTLIADFLLLCIPTIAIFITWFIFDMENYYDGLNGLNFFTAIIFNFQIASFAYMMSFIFVNPKSCISFMPTLLIVMAAAPSFCFSIFNSLKQALTGTSGAPSRVVGSIIWWATMVISPQGGLFGAFLATGEDLAILDLASFPPPGASIAVIILETALFLYMAMYIDEKSIAILTPIESERVVDETALDSDVVEERKRVLSSEKPGEKPLRIERLRKIYPPVKTGSDSVTAVEDVCFSLADGEVFGLLGANGAGKTSLLSMLTRLSAPTSGNAYIKDFSILREFRKVATNLGVVTQNNSLWDKLSVESHLYLFARLRGIPENMVKQVVEECIEELELCKHRKKLAMRLSGGMKRKLCVAIALIGDPKVVLLDEPSAGLDPVSRRNLWSVILRTMSHRSVILTTHSMEEAEALCSRIGIMVKGQLRALGSKQHLKSKFGSGFELVVKLVTTNFEEQNAKVLAFLRSSFPSTTVVNENGGLVTYKLVSAEVKMGLLFSELEANKEKLCIEDYSIAQPTLEQVFIRIVNEVSGNLEVFNEAPGMSSGKKRKGGDRLPLSKTKVKCGCSDFCLKIFAGIAIAVIIVGIVIGVALVSSYPIGAAVGVTVAIVAGVVLGTFICLLRCMCCRNPIEEA